MRRKVCVVTGSRAEYGLLSLLLQKLKDSSVLTLQLVATGMHLSPEFGLTYREIEADGFELDAKVESLVSSDTPVGIAKSMAMTLMSIGEVFNTLTPDIVVVLGDRFEIFAATAAAHVARIPVAHIHGGEVTEGAFDDAFRHSITKMSHLHFTATEEYRRRVIQLGEHPDRVHTVGALGIDSIRNLKRLSRGELQRSLGIRFAGRNILITFHPVTLENNTSQRQMTNLLSALETMNNTNCFFTKANADAHGRIINEMIDAFVENHPERAFGFTSLGQLRYLSLMSHVDCVLGNSSSGIVEAPSLRKPTINIGRRQEGRLRAASVVDCNPERNAIIDALELVFSEPFQEKLKNVVNPLGDGNASERICRMLEDADFKRVSLKRFYDVNQSD